MEKRKRWSELDFKAQRKFSRWLFSKSKLSNKQVLDILEVSYRDHDNFKKMEICDLYARFKDMRTYRFETNKEILEKAINLAYL